MKKTVWDLVFFICLAFWTGHLFASSPKKTETAQLDYDPSHLVVKFKSHIDQASADYISEKYGLELELLPSGDVRVLDIDFIASNPELLTFLEDEKIVKYIEPRYRCKAAYIPDDPSFYLQWNFKSFDQGGVDAVSAWDITTGDSSVIVAVADTGVAYEDYTEGDVVFAQAPDLAGTNFVSPRHFYYSFPRVKSDSHANDDNGHGTHVAGTIAQTTNNALGVAGIAHNCSIMPVKVLESDGGGYFDVVAEGVRYAADNGAHIINLSLAGPYSQLMKDAVDYADSKGCIMVCATGNENTSVDQYPAAYAKCIAVASTASDKTKSSFSNYGNYVDVAAPGSGIRQQTYQLTQDADGNDVPVNYTTFVFSSWSGTSMATPHVSAIAALLISNGITDPDKVREAIEGSALDIGDPGWDQYLGEGLVNAYAALKYYSPDLDSDGDIDTADFFMFCDNWLAQGPGMQADFNDDQFVDQADFAYLVYRLGQ